MTPTPTHIGTPGSLGPVVDQLMAVGKAASELENLTPSEQMLVYRWKPPRPPTRFPALWHLLLDPPPPEQRDLNRIRDFFLIGVYIGVRHSDQDKDFARLERLIDAYRDTCDPLVWTQRPLNGTATWAKRTGCRMVPESFDGVTVMCALFPVEIWLDRQLQRSN